MEDLRLTLANDVADQIGAVLYPGRCHCGWPLMKFKSDPVAFGFCWNCLTSQQTAQRGRDLLERIKRGIEVTHIGNEIYVEERKSA